MKMNMANQCLSMGRLDQAEALYRQVLADDPGHLLAMRALAGLYESQNQHRQAISLLRKIVELAPDDIESTLRLAEQLNALEEFKEARACFRRVLALQSRHLSALVSLANITRHTEMTKEVATMETLYQGEELWEETRRKFAFALGKIFDDLGEYDKAFGYFQAGNRIARAKDWRSTKAATRAYRDIKQLFDADFFRRHRGAGIADDSLILVIGMPRSGTTLIEQILASHPHVYGGGEVENLRDRVAVLAKSTGNPYPRGFDRIESSLLSDMVIQYRDELKAGSNGEARVTDKNVGNVLYIGLIGAMLPNAKIIHCSRDPRDQGLSFYQKDFDERQPFSYDLDDIARYHNRYQDMVDHWERMLPGRIFRVQYEEVVSDLEGNVRRLLEHCSLPFDEACLSFHNTQRVVGTASQMQVRRPLYASSVGRWKNYEQHLQPLIATLGA